MSVMRIEEVYVNIKISYQNVTQKVRGGYAKN